VKPILLLTLSLIVGFMSVAESPNPFTSKSSGQVAPSAGNAISAALAPLLRSLSDRLVELTRELHEARGFYPLLTLLLAAFGYGVFHALGPGHGKTMVSSLLIAREARLRQSAAMGFSIALVHSVSALAIVMILYFVIHGIFSADFESAARIIRILSFGLVAIVGGAMLYRKIRGVGHKHHGHRGAGRDGHDSDMPGKSEGELSGREIWGVALASGIVPCPGASAIILLSLSLDMVLVSVLAVTAISIGMGLTISVIGAMAILSRRGLLRAAEGRRKHDERRASLFRGIIEILGSCFLFLFGLISLIAQF
jgi:ABC-type nickel/cobalt efflux system permease component RcnA